MLAVLFFVTGIAARVLTPRKKQMNMPTELVADAPALNYMSFGANQLTSVPENLFANTPALNYMSFGNNQLTSVPENLFTTPALNYISFGNNQLTSVPENLFTNTPALNRVNLPELEELIIRQEMERKSAIKIQATFRMHRQILYDLIPGNYGCMCAKRRFHQNMMLLDAIDVKEFF